MESSGLGFVRAQRGVAAKGAHGGIQIAGLAGGVAHGIEHRDVLRLQFRRLLKGLLRLPVVVTIHQRDAQRTPGGGIAAIQF